MSTALDDLFVQIIQSEGKAKEEKKLLNGVKSDIAAYKQKIATAEGRKEAMRGKLVQKVQSQITAELEENWALSRAGILQSQVKSLGNELANSKLQLKELICHMDDEREDSLSRIREFTTQYDLLSYSTHHRDNAARGEITALKEELRILREEEEAYGGFSKIMLELQAAKDDLEMTIKSYTNDKLAQEIEEAQEKLTALVAKKTEVADSPQTDPDFKRLQSELEDCRKLNLESKYNAMQQELKDLQRQCWQKTVQEQQKQKQHQKYQQRELHQQQQQQQQQQHKQQPDQDKSAMKTPEKTRKFNFQRFTNYGDSQEEDDLAQLADVFSEEMKEEIDITPTRTTPTSEARKRPNLRRLTNAISQNNDEEIAHKKTAVMSQATKVTESQVRKQVQFFTQGKAKPARSCPPLRKGVVYSQESSQDSQPL